MTVGDIVTQLKYGELRTVSIKDDVPAIVSYINLAMTTLYSRFRLSKKEQIIDLLDNIALYDLNDDVLLVESVYNELGVQIPLNDEDNVLSAFTPTYDTIQIPNSSTGAQVAVMYVANPAALLVDADDSVTKSQTVRLPSVLLEPLLHYVGYRAHGSMDGDIKAENNTHYMRYEASCRRIKESGVIREDVVQAKVSQAEGVM